MADRSHPEPFELKMPQILLGIDWLINRRLAVVESARCQLLKSAKPSVKRSILDSVSNEFRSMRYCLQAYFIGFNVLLGIIDIRLIGHFPKLAVQLVEGFILYFLADALNRRITDIETLQLDLWRLSGIASISNLISFLPKTAKQGSAEHVLERIKILNSFLSEENTIDFVSDEDRIRLARFAQGNEKLSKKRLALKFQLQLTNHLLKNLKRTPKDLWVND